MMRLVAIVLGAIFFAGCGLGGPPVRMPRESPSQHWGQATVVAPQLYERGLMLAGGRQRHVLSNRPGVTSEPVIVVIDGSGCGSTVVKNGDGSLNERFWGQITASFGAQYRIVSIEKAGVALFADADDGGPDCSALYQQHASLEERILEQESLISALVAERPELAGRIVAIGQSEGAVVAAFLGKNSGLRAIGVLSGLGPSQAFDFALMFRKRSRGGNPSNIEASVESCLASIRDILSSPQRTDKFVWGHSYKRWASYISKPVSEALAGSSVPTFVAHGSEDSSAQIEGFDYFTG